MNEFPRNKFIYLAQQLNIPEKFKLFERIVEPSSYQKYLKLCPNDQKKDYNMLIKQSGGGSKEYHLLRHDGLEFKLFKVNEVDSISYSLHRRDDSSDRDYCVAIFVYKKAKFARIDDLTFHTDCFSKKQREYYKNKKEDLKGNKLVKIAIGAVRSLKNHYNIDYITLRDASKKEYGVVSDDVSTEINIFNFPLGPIEIRLGLMYTYLNGDTWYGKFGFRPANDKENNISNIGNKQYNRNSDIMENIKVKDCKTLKNYLIESKKKIWKKIIKNMKNERDSKDTKNKTELKKISEEINNYVNDYKYIEEDVVYLLKKYENKLLSKFVFDFLKMKNAYYIFDLFYRELADDIGLTDFFYDMFIMFI